MISETQEFAPERDCDAEIISAGPTGIRARFGPDAIGAIFCDAVRESSSLMGMSDGGAA
jgi:hypothetical protein